MEFIVPEPFEVTHWTRPRLPGKTPAGQVRYGDPVPRQRWVRGFEPAGADEIQKSQLAGRKVTELLMATAEGDWPSDSIVEFRGQRYEVNGDVRDENLGPYGFTPGYVVQLRKVTNNGPA